MSLFIPQLISINETSIEINSCSHLSENPNGDTMKKRTIINLLEIKETQSAVKFNRDMK